MASKKISQLPSASSVTNASLLAVVNTTSGVTEKATISQLPIGITAVTNLGGGSTLGSITGDELRLKTLIPGVATTFTVNGDTITINNNLNVSNVGTGISLVNSFANPNLALKTITGSSGITITDNTTSINISSSVNSSLDSIIGSIEIPTVKLYTLENYITKAYSISRIYLNNASGSATVRLVKQDALGVTVANSPTYNVTTTRSSNIISSFTTTVGEQLVLEVLTTSTSLNLSFTIEINYL